MGEQATLAVTIPRPSASSSSSALRFLGLLKQPDDPDLTPKPNRYPSPGLELDESDVVWSSPYHSSSSSSSSPVSASSPSSTLRRPARPFVPEKLGLSAALDDDTPPLRRPAVQVARPIAVPAVRPNPSPVRKAFNQSAPVAVPAWPARRKEMRNSQVEAVDENWDLEEEKERDFEDEEWEGGEEDEGMVPPHVIVARSHVTSFSVLEGAGRTLKGRDLRRVRNAVWQKTGFLDL